MMYAVVTYATMRGVRAVDRIVELCERDLAFIWLKMCIRDRYGGKDNPDLPVGQFICPSVKLTACRGFSICCVPKEELIHRDMICLLYTSRCV